MEDIQLVQEQILHALMDTPDLDPVQELVRLQETGMDRLPLAVKVNLYVTHSHLVELPVILNRQITNLKYGSSS